MMGTDGYAPAAMGDEAMEKLLGILRARGSITEKEFQELSAVSKPATAPVSAAPVLAPTTTTYTSSPLAPRAGSLEARLDEDERQLKKVEGELEDQQKSLLRLKEITDGTSPALVSTALKGKWYERVRLSGYTQFRYSKTFSKEGPELNVPNDRSATPTESLLIRRGRMVVSGDISDHLFMYTQADLAAGVGAADLAVQMRDMYGDISIDKDKEFRFRLGQSKVPYGWVNLQSSQNRAPLERPDAINSAAEGERDLGAYFMWAPKEVRERFRDLVRLGLKGSGDYGVVAVGAYSGQGLNRSDLNGEPHVLARLSYPFKLDSGQFFELGVQGYHGRFVSPTTPIKPEAITFTPTQPVKGRADQRVGVSAIWYAQPFGIEAEYNIGRGPQLAKDFTAIESASLHGGYVQLNYRKEQHGSVWYPFTRWNYYDGGRKFGANAPRSIINEWEIGLEFSPWREVEITAVFTHSFERTNTRLFPYNKTENADRLGLQVQWNY